MAQNVDKESTDLVIRFLFEEGTILNSVCIHKWYLKMSMQLPANWKNSACTGEHSQCFMRHCINSLLGMGKACIKLYSIQ